MHIHLFTFMQIFFYFFDNTRTIPSCTISLAFNFTVILCYSILLALISTWIWLSLASVCPVT